MGQSVSQLVTREHFDAELRLTREHFDARISGIESRIGGIESRISGVESRVKSLEATVRAEMMRAVLITVGILIPAIGLMMAIAEFYSARGGGV